MLILAIWGAIADSRYKRKGGKRPSKRDKILFLVALLLVAATFVTLALLGATAEAFGSVTPDIAILLFATWELGRWRVRRKNPLALAAPPSPTPVAPSPALLQSQEQRILDEVRRRKERARQSGVITTAFSLYRNDLPHYDAWATNCPHLLHPAVKVTNKTRTSSRNESAERIEATIRGNSYVFTFRESTTFMPDGEPFTCGYLDVDFQGQRVTTIDCRCEDDEYAGRTWSPNDVSAFIEGLWVDELNSVFAEVKRLHEEQNKRWQEQAKREELEKLKRNFGL